MRTWVYESGVVAVVLLGTAIVAGGSLLNWLGAAAVFLSFSHASVSNRLAEREAARPDVQVSCHQWAARYWVAKEALWIVVWVLSGIYTALAGSLLFLLYPYWRRVYRRRRPLRS